MKFMDGGCSQGSKIDARIGKAFAPTHIHTHTHHDGVWHVQRENKRVVVRRESSLLCTYIGDYEQIHDGEVGDGTQ